MRWAEKFCLAMSTFTMKHIMLSVILHLKKNVEFICSVDKY